MHQIFCQITKGAILSGFGYYLGHKPCFLTNNARFSAKNEAQNSTLAYNIYNFSRHNDYLFRRSSL